MDATPGKIRALHIHDAASVGRNLVQTANELGQPWSMTGLPWYYRRQWQGPAGRPVRMTRRHVWDATLALQSLRADVVHLHTGQLALHGRWLRRPWVLHLHGTDVRTNQYQERWAETLRYGASHADAVVYSTPDLEAHVRNLMKGLPDNAVYLPVTVRLDQAPVWNPVPRRVIFASRWEAVKGGAAQVEVATRLRELRPDLELLGLDWGDLAPNARAAGVVTVPRMSYDAYRSWLATASVVVGQMTDILSASELEALATGVPLVGGADPRFYPQLTFLTRDRSPRGAAESALRAVDDPVGAAARQDGKGFIAEVHDAPVGVRQLTALYAGLIQARGRP